MIFSTKRVFVTLDSRCSNRCLFCQDKGLRPGPHPAGPGPERIRGLARSKTECLLITGRDVLDAPDVLAAVRSAREHSFRRIVVQLPPGRRAGLSRLDDLLAGGVEEYEVPLYGSCAKVHDRIAGAQGAFRSVLKMLRILSKARARVRLRTMLLKQNLDDLPRLTAFVCREFPRARFDIEHYRPHRDSRRSYASLMPTYRKSLPSLMRSVDLCRRAWKDGSVFEEFILSFLAFPFCALRPLGLHRGLMSPRALTGLVVQRAKDVSFPYAGRLKPGACGSCRWTALCLGFFGLYLKTYGAGELCPE